MVIWLRNHNIEWSGDPCAATDIGVCEDDDILRREAYASIVALEAAGAACRERHDAVLAAAQERAREIVALAEEEARALKEQAERAFSEAEQRGYEAGKTQALSEWYARVAQQASEQRAMHEMLRTRMAELVVVAVEQIVRSEDRSALFARSATVIDRIAEGCTSLKVRVHPDDYEAAAREFGRFTDEMRQRGRMAPVTVTIDGQLDRGACLCESDLGVVDASLTTQLAAIREAVQRALTHEIEEEAT
jgi:type III secretion protein L